MNNTPRVAIIGAGSVGGNLGIRLSNAGIPVRFGVRSGTPKMLQECKDASASSVEDAVAWADVIFVAVPGPAAVDVVRSLASQLLGKIVVDCNNPLTWDNGPVWSPPAEGSLTAAMAQAAPGVHLVKGFSTFGAEFHKDPSTAAGPTQVFLAGDDAESKKRVSELATQAGFRPVDSGPLRNAAVLENLAILWVHLATVGGQGREFTFQMNGRG